MAKVKVAVPENVTFVANDRVYRSGEEFEADLVDVEQFIRAGNLVEVKRKKA